MKIVKVRIHRVRIPKQPRMGYPVGFDADEVMKWGIGPLSLQRGGGAYSALGRHPDEQWCLIALEDIKADEYARDPDMELIDGDTANALMETWRIANNEPEEIDLDPARIQAIAAKQAAGIELSADDLRILDPDDEMRGRNKRLRKVEDVLADIGKTLTPLLAKA